MKVTFEIDASNKIDLSKVSKFVSALSGDSSVKSANKPATQKPWSQKYPACVICGTTKRRHFGHGRCSKCYLDKNIPKATTSGETKKKKQCHYARCPYMPTDYREKDMVKIGDFWYCSDECAEKEKKEAL